MELLQISDTLSINTDTIDSISVDGNNVYITHKEGNDYSIDEKYQSSIITFRNSKVSNYETLDIDF